ncbi:MAG: peptidylprolyl isomerase [Coriobacteriia bacterium]
MRITRRISIVLIAVLLAALLPGCSSDKNTVAKVNGEKITKTQFDSLFNQAVTSMGGSVEDTATLNQQVLDYLIESAVVAQEAENLGADLSDEAIETSITAIRGDMSADDYAKEIESAGYTMDQVKTSVRDQIAREFLAKKANEDSATATLPEDYALLEHILVTSETTATAVSAQLKEEGADFATLAATYSEDTYSAIAGGSLGWASYSSYVSEFGDAAEKLEVGAISEPIQSDYGWHIIRKVAEEKKGTSLAKLPADMLTDLQNAGVDLALDAYVKKLRDAADIVYVDESLKPTTTETE